MANRWGNNRNSDRLYFSGLQNHCRWWLQPWNEKMLAPLKKSYDQPSSVQFSSVQSLSGVQLFVTPWITAHQASLSITNSWSLLKLMSIELVMPSNHLILCHPLLLLSSIFPMIRVFYNESAICIGGQSIAASASASVLPMNIQDWFPLE